jgi:hypothetical protein
LKELWATKSVDTAEKSNAVSFYRSLIEQSNVAQEMEADTSAHFLFIHDHSVDGHSVLADLENNLDSKDGVMLNEGDVGYNNPYDYSAVCFERNYLGALNNEVFHLLMRSR